MKVIEHINSQKETQFSYEIIPPLRGRGIKIIIDMIEDLKDFNPPFIDVTSHSSSAQQYNNGKTVLKRKAIIIINLFFGPTLKVGASGTSRTSTIFEPSNSSI